MKAFDTNVLVRVLVGDDPAQTPLAERAFAEHARGGGVFVSSVVLVEIAWVLASGYALDRTTVHERLDKLVRTRGVFVEHSDVVREALRRYRDGRADFPDFFLLGSAEREHASPVLTFDRRLAGEEGAELLA